MLGHRVLCTYKPKGVVRVKFIVSLFCFLLLVACTARSPTPKPAENFKSYIKYVNARFSAALNKTFDPADPRPKLLLIGDSQAKDFLNSAQEHGYFNRYQVSMRYISSLCQIFLGSAQHSGVAKHRRMPCQKADNLQRALPQIAEADVIIFSGLWRKWAIKQLPSTIRNLRLRPSQKLVVVGRKSYSPITMSAYKSLPMAERVKKRSRIDRRFLTVNTDMLSWLTSTRFVDQYSLVCGVGSHSCPIFTPEGEFITFDGGHLTKAGARYFGRLLFQSTALKGLL